MNNYTISRIRKLAESNRENLGVRTLARAILDMDGVSRRRQYSERVTEATFELAFFIEDPAGEDEMALASALISFAMRTPVVHRRTMADWLNARNIDWAIPAETGPGKPKE